MIGEAIQKKKKPDGKAVCSGGGELCVNSVKEVMLSV